MTDDDKVKDRRSIAKSLEINVAVVFRNDWIVVESIRERQNSVVLDQACFAEGMVVEGMGSTDDVRQIHTPLGPGMDLTTRLEDEEELEE